VSNRAGVDAVVKRKIDSPCRDSNPESSNMMKIKQVYRQP